MEKYIVYILNEDGSKSPVHEYPTLAEAEAYEDAQPEDSHSIEFYNGFEYRVIS